MVKLKKEENFKWEEEHQKAFEEIKTYLMNPPVLLPPIKNRPMKLYIAASDLTIGSMLAQENNFFLENKRFY